MKRVAFVGRHDEMEALEKAAQRVCSGERCFVWIEGEGGIGKTALLQHLLEAPQLSGFRVLCADGARGESSLRYSLLTALLVPAGREGSRLLWLLRSNEGVHLDLLRVGTEFLEVLSKMASKAPLLLLVDDVHFADRFSWEALWFALRRLGSARVLTVVSGRPEASIEFGDPWRRLLSGDQIQRIQLGPLDAAAIGELSEQMGRGKLASGDARRLLRDSGGVPLYLVALMEELTSGALADEAGLLPVPACVSRQVVSALERLTTEARGLLLASAVWGHPAPLVTLGRILATSEVNLGLSEAIALAGPGSLEEMERAGQEASAAELLSRCQGDVFVIKHVLVRRAIYDQIPGSARYRLHLAAAALSSDERNLFHRVEAARILEEPDEALAEELQRLANGRLAAKECSHSARLLEWAARVGTPAKEHERLLASALALLQGKDMLQLNELIANLVEYPATPSTNLVLGAHALWHGRLVEARSYLEPCGSSEESTGEAVTRKALLAAGLYLEGRFHEAERLSRSAALAEGMPGVMSFAHGIRALSLAAQSDCVSGLALIGKATSSCCGSAQAHLQVIQGVLMAQEGDLNGALDVLESVTSSGSSDSPVQFLSLGMATLAEVKQRLGLWDEAIAQTNAAVCTSANENSTWTSVIAWAAASYIRAARNETSVQDILRRVSELESSYPSWLTAFYSTMAHAYVAKFEGDYQRVVSILGEAETGEPWKSLSRQGTPWARAMRAEALIVTRNGDAASSELDELSRVLEGKTLSPVHSELWRLRGLLAYSEGQLDEAGECFMKATELAREKGFSLEQAMSCQALGSVLRQKGDSKRAVSLLRLSREILVGLKAWALLGGCDEELKRCGVKGSDRSRKGQLALTQSQLKVAELASTGLTNRQIAQRLSLSEKTVEYHLWQVFVKLGISRRRELTRWVFSQEFGNPDREAR